jgi:hypothetical protein
MGNGQLSIGDDTATGEPENGPKGPYITDKDDGSRRKDRKPLPSRTETEITRKSEHGSFHRHRTAEALEARWNPAKLPSHRRFQAVNQGSTHAGFHLQHLRSDFCAASDRFIRKSGQSHRLCRGEKVRSFGIPEHAVFSGHVSLRAAGAGSN